MYWKYAVSSHEPFEFHVLHRDLRHSEKLDTFGAVKIWASSGFLGLPSIRYSDQSWRLHFRWNGVFGFWMITSYICRRSLNWHRYPKFLHSSNLGLERGVSDFITISSQFHEPVDWRKTCATIHRTKLQTKQAFSHDFPESSRWFKGCYTRHISSYVE